jgi:CBS domain-containing protein
MSQKYVKEIMTKDVVTIEKETTIGELSSIMLKNRVSGLPVVDNEGMLIGMVTDADIILRDNEPVFPIYFDPLIISYAYIENFEKYQKDFKDYLDTRVEEIMKRRVRTVKEDTTVEEAASIMVKERINRIPVIDNERKVLGIVARADILRFIVDKKD